MQGGGREGKGLAERLKKINGDQLFWVERGGVERAGPHGWQETKSGPVSAGQQGNASVAAPQPRALLLNATDTVSDLPNPVSSRNQTIQGFSVQLRCISFWFE